MSALRAQAPVALSSTRPPYFLLVRESGRKRAALRQMLEQTLTPYVVVPGVQEALDAGLGPFEHPEEWGATRVGRSGTRGVIYMVQGNWFFVVEGSAALEDPENQARFTRAENVFVNVLCDQLVAIRPHKLVVATFSRLVRSDEFSGQLARVVRRNVDEVHCSDVPVFEPATDAGRHTWNMATQFSTMERSAILRRMTTGSLATAARGRWPLSARCLPPGYTLTKDKKVVPDPSQYHLVTSLVEILATPNLTARETTYRLNAAGMKPRRSWERHDEEADDDHISTEDSGDPAGGTADSRGDVDPIRHYGNHVRGLVAWLDVFRTGKWVYRRTNPLPGEKQLGGFVVQGADHDNPGYLEVEIDLGLPDGGWGPPDTIDAAEANWSQPRARGGRQGRVVRPLTNVVAWQSDGWSYKLLSTGNDMYYVSRKHSRGEQLIPGEPSPTGTGWNLGGQRDGECIASMRIDEVHASIAQAVMTSVRDGVEMQHLDGWATIRTNGGVRAFDARSNRLAILDREIAAAESRFRGAQRVATAVADNRGDDTGLEEELAKRLAGDVRTAMAEVQRLRQEREVLATKSYLPPDFGEGFQGEAAFLARTMANLETCRGSVPRDVARALAEILRNFRFDVDQVEARWKGDIMLLMKGSYLRFTVEGVVPNRLKPMRSNGSLFNSELVERVLWNGESFSRLSLSYGQLEMSESWRMRMIKALVDLGLGAAAARIIFSAPPEIGKVIYGHLRHLDLPTEIDADWAALVVRTYTNPEFVWKRSSWYFHVARHQLVMDALVGLGGDASFGDLAALVPKDRIYRCSDPPGKHNNYFPPTVIRGGRWDKRPANLATRRLSLIACPHSGCGGQCETAIWTPEVARGMDLPVSVICRKCRRVPVPDSPVFPDIYLRLGEPWMDVCCRCHNPRRVDVENNDTPLEGSHEAPPECPGS